MSLEELIRDAAKRGELTYLSVLFNGGEFRATCSPASKFGHEQAASRDPVEALANAIKATRKRKGQNAARPDSEIDFG